ncbi:hypothetical protein SLA2020_438560 [Shorea laevis]
MTERRRGEKQGKLMKRIAMGTVSAFALVTLIAVAFFVGASKWGDSSDTKPSQSPPQQTANEASHSINKVIKMIVTLRITRTSARTPLIGQWKRTLICLIQKTFSRLLFQQPQMRLTRP